MNSSTLALGPALLAARAWAAFPTAITHQGELHENGVPKEGNVDLAFAILDENGQTSQIFFAADVPVVRGLFTTSLALNPGVASNAQNYQLLIGVREGSLDTGLISFCSLRNRSLLHCSQLTRRASRDCAPWT